MVLHRAHGARHALADEPARLEGPSCAQRADDGGLIANGVGKRLAVVRDTSGEDSQAVVPDGEPLRVTDEGCDLVTLLQRPRDHLLPGSPRGAQHENFSWRRRFTPSARDEHHDGSDDVAVVGRPAGATWRRTAASTLPPPSCTGSR